MPAEIVTNDLGIHLDAADVNSYPGTGQVWKDISGNGEDFVLGKNQTVEATDPQFEGGAFVFGNVTFFTKSGSNGALIDGLHRAGARFTIEIWHSPQPSAYYIALGTTNNSGITGFRWLLDGILDGFSVYDGGFANPVFQSPKVNLRKTFGTWQAVAISVDTNAQSGFFMLDGELVQSNGAGSFPVVYNAPSTSSAANLLRLGTQTNDGAAVVPSGSKYGIVRIYKRALSPSELRQNFCAQRGRYGI